MDNWSEFISIALAEWAEENKVHLEFIKPRKPTQNSYVEHFNRTYRNEVLDYYVFRSLREVRDITDNWLREYNDERPHESLGTLTPSVYRLVKTNEQTSKNVWHYRGMLTMAILSCTLCSYTTSHFRMLILKEMPIFFKTRFLTSSQIVFHAVNFRALLF